MRPGTVVAMSKRSRDGMERIDEDPDAVTGDTRVRVEADDHDTYVLCREKYGLAEFESAGENAFERYDWHTDETFVLRGDSEAKQFASMLSDEGAFDPNVLFFRQRDFPGENGASNSENTAHEQDGGRDE